MPFLKGLSKVLIELLYFTVYRRFLSGAIKISAS